jgi:GntR family transcriptional repressor for pyruvate dehydrogenase complex
MSNFTLHQVERVRVFEHAVEQIRSAIERGELKPDDRLPTEQELSAQLGVGRSSIREAIRVLESEGLIEVRRGAGTFIAHEAPRLLEQDTTITAWLSKRRDSLIQILQIREKIECLTAGLAAALVDESLTSKLSKIIREQEELVESGNDIDRFSQLDCDFHLSISAASGNEIADEIMQHIVPAFNESNKAVIFTGKRSRKIIDEHKSILEALLSGNAEDAEAFMEDHIRHVQAVILALEADNHQTPES